MEKTYIVTEYCAFCESEIEMKWNDELGYKAYCPFCGQRLMLCDECQHRFDILPLVELHANVDSNM